MKVTASIHTFQVVKHNLCSCSCPGHSVRRRSAGSIYDTPGHFQGLSRMRVLLDDESAPGGVRLDAQYVFGIEVRDLRPVNHAYLSFLSRDHAFGLSHCPNLRYYER